MGNQVRKNAELTSSAKAIITDILIEAGFLLEETENLVNGKRRKLLRAYKEHIAMSELQYEGFKEFLKKNIIHKEEWEYEHYNFYECMWSKCIYCDKERGYCRYYKKSLDEIKEEQISECR